MRRPPRWLKGLIFLLATLFFVATLDKWSHHWHFICKDSQEREYWVDLRTVRNDGNRLRFTLVRRGGGPTVSRRFEIDYARRHMVPLEGDRTPEVIAPGSVAEKLYLDLDSQRK